METPKKKTNNNAHIEQKRRQINDKWKQCALSVEHSNRYPIFVNITVNVSVCMLVSVSSKNKHCIPKCKLWLTIHINIAKCCTIFYFLQCNEYICCRRHCCQLLFYSFRAARSQCPMFIVRIFFVLLILFWAVLPTAFVYPLKKYTRVQLRCFHPEIIFHI